MMGPATSEMVKRAYSNTKPNLNPDLGPNPSPTNNRNPNPNPTPSPNPHPDPNQLKPAYAPKRLCDMLDYVHAGTPIPTPDPNPNPNP